MAAGPLGASDELARAEAAGSGLEDRREAVEPDNEGAKPTNEGAEPTNEGNRV